MARQTIIDWQRDGLLVAVCQAQAGRVNVDALSAQPIGSPVGSGEESESDTPNSLTAEQALGRAVEELGLRKAEVTIVAPRELVEVRTLAIPRIEANELPDVIRFQAQRQLANMGDNWALDYIMLPEAPGQEMRTALVAVISPAVLNEMESACTSAGLNLTHVALRPIEIARFATQSGNLPADASSMVVCLSQQDADLLILDRGRVVQIRSTKIPLDADRMPAALAGELRRGLAAVANQMGNQTLASGLLIADPQLADRLQATVAQAIGCPVTTLDPREVVSGRLSSAYDTAATATNRIIGIAGAAQMHAANKQTIIDFKDPKKRPPPKSKSTTYLLAAATAAVLLLMASWWWIGTNRQLDDDLALYQAEIANKKNLVAVAEERMADLREIERFLLASPNWLDEMDYLAERIPSADKIIVGDPLFSVLSDGAGQISLPVAADSSMSISAFEKSLRDDQHVLEGKNIMQMDPPTELYKWKADETIVVRGRGWNLVSQLDTSRQAGQSPSAPSPAASSEANESPADEEGVQSATDSSLTDAPDSPNT